MRVVKFFAIIYFKTNCLNIITLIANLYAALAIDSFYCPLYVDSLKTILLRFLLTAITGSCFSLAPCTIPYGRQSP